MRKDRRKDFMEKRTLKKVTIERGVKEQRRDVSFKRGRE